MFSCLDNILNSMEYAFFALDREWRIVYINSKAEELLLRKKEELLGQSVWQEFPGAVESVFFRECQHAMEQRKVVEFEDFYPPLGKWLELRAVPYDGGLSICFHDATAKLETRRMTRALNNIITAINSTLEFNEVMQRTMAEAVSGMGCQSASIALLIQDYWEINYMHNFRVGQVRMPRGQSPFLEGFLVAKSAVVVEKSDLPRHISDWQVWEDLCLAAVVGVPLYTKDEYTGVLFFSFQGILDQAVSQAQLDFANQIAASVSVALTNVRLYHEARENARRAEELVRVRTEYLEMADERFAKAFLANPCMMSIHDADGNFVDVNESFQRTTGWSKWEFLGRTTDEIGMCDGAVNAEIYRLFRENGRVESMDIVFFTRSGQRREAIFSAERIFLNRHEFMLTLLHDITDRVMLQQEMARLDRMNLVGQLAASFGHEIRNPMTTARGFMQFLKGKLESEQHKMYLDLVIDELDRANDIISEYLSLARNKFIDRKKANLNVIIQTMFPLIQADGLLESKTVRFLPGELPELLVDQKEMRQLILNLCHNGLQAMDSGSELTIRTWQDGQEAVMAIADQGSGIAEEIRDKLGTPFVTTKDTGSGLGLAVCYNIIERHKGRMEYETGREGTTFYVRFPLE